MNTHSPQEERMHDTGFMDRISFAGVQFDTMSGNKEEDGRLVGASRCFHSCSSKRGPYQCPADFEQNRNIVPTSIASGSQIVNWVNIAAAGLRLARDRYLGEDYFDRVCDRFGLSDSVRALYRKNMQLSTVEGNEFGGDPEQHNDSLQIIAGLKQGGHRVNLTSTGGRFCSLANRDTTWVDEFMLPANQPQVFATSADDFLPGDFDRLLGLDREGLAKERMQWARLKMGQRQKRVEAIAVAQYAKQALADGKQFPRLLFNMVLHRQNMREARTIWSTLEREFPFAIVNPYPVQLAFNKEGNFFNFEELQVLRELILYCIERTLNGSQFVKRLPYWLMLEAVFRTYGWGKWEDISRTISGYGLWTCYAGPGTGWYLQLGRAKEGLFTVAGGQPSCFWDANVAGTVTAGYQVSTPEQIVEYLFGGMQAISSSKEDPCGGCGMPRLNSLNELVLLVGMNPIFLPAYMEAKREFAAFAV